MVRLTQSVTPVRSALSGVDNQVADNDANASDDVLNDVDDVNLRYIDDDAMYALERDYVNSRQWRRIRVTSVSSAPFRHTSLHYITPIASPYAPTLSTSIVPCVCLLCASPTGTHSVIPSSSSSSSDDERSSLSPPFFVSHYWNSGASRHMFANTSSQNTFDRVEPPDCYVDDSDDDEYASDSESDIDSDNDAESDSTGELPPLIDSDDESDDGVVDNLDVGALIFDHGNIVHGLAHEFDCIDEHHHSPLPDDDFWTIDQLDIESTFDSVFEPISVFFRLSNPCSH